MLLTLMPVAKCCMMLVYLMFCRVLEDSLIKENVSILFQSHLIFILSQWTFVVFAVLYYFFPGVPDTEIY